MKIYGKRTVLEAALDRIRGLFDEFEHIIVNVSGGKDSTVVLNLALQVAEEKGRLPLDVLFVDQESEWRATVDMVREIMSDPRVRPLWVQCPFRLSNGASTEDDWLACWSDEPGAQWMREKEPDSIHENVFGTRTFAELFGKVAEHYYPGGSICKLAGVRCEESPARMKGLTTYETFKGRTWGKVENKRLGHYTFYPIYDWSFTDVWKAIHDHGWSYNRLYDYQYMHGVTVANMRVSSLSHDSALPALHYMQEIEPDTWEALTKRLSGVHTVGQMKRDFMAPKELPPMFRDWAEYRDYLVDNLVTDPDKRALFHEQFARACARYEDEVIPKLVKTQIKAVLKDDYHGVAMESFAAANGRYAKGRGSKGGDESDDWRKGTRAKA